MTANWPKLSKPPVDVALFQLKYDLGETELKNYLAYYPNCCTYEDALCIQDLLNIRSFAPQIHCHVHFATGLFDDDCPPHGSFTLYNSIPSSNKQYTVYPHDSHIGESNYTQMLLEWFDKLFTSL